MIHFYLIAPFSVATTVNYALLDPPAQSRVTRCIPAKGTLCPCPQLERLWSSSLAVWKPVGWGEKNPPENMIKSVVTSAQPWSKAQSTTFERSLGGKKYSHSFIDSLRGLAVSVVQLKRFQSEACNRPWQEIQELRAAAERASRSGFGAEQRGAKRAKLFLKKWKNLSEQNDRSRTRARMPVLKQGQTANFRLNHKVLLHWRLVLTFVEELKQLYNSVRVHYTDYWVPGKLLSVKRLMMYWIALTLSQHWFGKIVAYFRNEKCLIRGSMEVEFIES